MLGALVVLRLLVELGREVEALRALGTPRRARLRRPFLTKISAARPKRRAFEKSSAASISRVGSPAGPLPDAPI